MSDRASVAATAIVHTVTAALHVWLRDHSVCALREVHPVIAAYLRDEFADIKREAAGERALTD